MDDLNIIWLTLDAVRRDRLSLYGYPRKTSPNLTEFAEKSVVFEEAVPNSIWTLPSVGSMFTGLYPSQHGLENSRKDSLRAPTLAQILDNRGYDTVLIQGNAWITHSELTKGFNRVIDKRFLKFYENPLPNFDLPADLDKIYNFIPGLLNRVLRNDITSSTIHYAKDIIPNLEKPFFAYIHMGKAHFPFRPPLEYQKYNDEKIPFIPLWDRRCGFYSNWIEKRITSQVGESEFSEEKIELVNDLYDDCLVYLDEQLGKLFDFLSDEGLLSNTIVIVTSDHGEMLGEEGKIQHQFSFSESLLNVPLIIFHPELEGRRTRELIESKSVFDILLNLLESQIEDFYKPLSYAYGEWKAIPKEAEKAKEVTPDIFTAARYIRTKKLKYIDFNDGRDEIYDISEGEERIESTEVLNLMRRLMKIKRSTVKKGKLTEDERKKLRNIKGDGE